LCSFQTAFEDGTNITAHQGSRKMGAFLGLRPVLPIILFNCTAKAFTVLRGTPREYKGSWVPKSFICAEKKKMVIITRTQTTQSKSGMAAKDSWEKSILTSIFTHTRKRASHQWVSYIPRLHFGIGWFAFEVEHSIRLLHLCFFFNPISSAMSCRTVYESVFLHTHF